MDAQTASDLRSLLDTASIAALATLHKGEPAVSMTPFAFLPAVPGLVVHVSALATHTQDMQKHTQVALLVTAQCEQHSQARALPRVSLSAQVRWLDPKSDGNLYSDAKAAYLQRFPDAKIAFELADFSLVLLTPKSARLIAGFGRAYSLVGADLNNWLQQKPV